MKKTIILCLSILLVALTGCKKDQNSWGKLDEGAITLKVGETKQLTFGHDGNEYPQWASENEDIATVDANGVVTGVRVGSTTVSVSGLSCKVTVTDDYMEVVEPFQNWNADYASVNEYMTKNYGNSAMVDLKNDTAVVINSITSRNDTVRTSIPGTDPEEYDTVITEIKDTLYDTIPYVSYVKYTYSVLGQFVDEYEYTITFDNATKLPVLSMAKMKVNDAHKNEIATYLNNRYVETGSKYYKAKNAWNLTSHIYDNNPTIVYSASQKTE